MRSDDAKALTEEIFSITGQKVAIDDPIVVAALVQSRLIRRAGADAAAEVLSAAGRMLAAGQGGQDTAQALRDAAAASARALRSAARRAIAEQAAAAVREDTRRAQAARVEAAGHRSALVGEAKKVFDAIQAAGSGRRLAVVVALVALVSGLAGAVVGYAAGDPTIRSMMVQRLTPTPAL